MVKLYSVSILYRNQQGTAQLLKAAYDLSSFGFFQRSSVQEFMTFTAKIITERTQPASRQSVKQGGEFNVQSITVKEMLTFTQYYITSRIPLPCFCKARWSRMCNYGRSRVPAQSCAYIVNEDSR